MVSDRREQSVSISSALVSPSRSEALVRALQTAVNPFDYRVPDADDELQIDHQEFQLKGWVTDRRHSTLVDELDPWAGDITYPAIAPAEFVTTRMQLIADSEQRTWYASNNGSRECLRCQIWGQPREKNEENPREYGRRLQANPGFIVDLLRQTRMDLTIEVQLDRRICRSRYSGNDVGDYEFVPKSARMFLVKTNGDVVTL